MEKDRTLDCYGLVCPMPIIRVSQEIKKMSPGQILEVIATDAGIKEDMPAWCQTTGNEYLGLEEQGDEYRVYVRKR
jgi:tRNA 2-thiouridine synthesizing protein A